MVSTELKPIDCCLLFTEDEAKRMQGQVKSQHPRFCELKEARIAAEAAQAAAESNIQSVTVSKSALRGEAEELGRSVEEVVVEVARVHQKGDTKVGDVLSECSGLQERHYATVSQVLGAPTYLTAACERLRHHF